MSAGQTPITPPNAPALPRPISLHTFTCKHTLTHIHILVLLICHMAWAMKGQQRRAKEVSDRFCVCVCVSGCGYMCVRVTSKGSSAVNHKVQQMKLIPPFLYMLGEGGTFCLSFAVKNGRTMKSNERRP